MLIFSPTLLGLTFRCRVSSVAVLICVFRPRLTSAASQQLDSLLFALQEISLGDGPDDRLLKLTNRPYSVRDTYTALDSSRDVRDVHGRLIWRSRLPNKVKIFAWLYFKDRLSTKVNLFSKHIVGDATCERCFGEEEDRAAGTCLLQLWCKLQDMGCLRDATPVDHE